LLGAKRGVRCYQRVSEEADEHSGVPILCGIGLVRAPLAEVFALCSDADKRTLWDTFYDQGHIVQASSSGQENLVYFKTKSQWTVWARDFFVMACYRPLDGSDFKSGYLMCASSAENESLAPLDASCVRGNVFQSGFVLRPTEDGTGTYVTYIFRIDGCGWVPQSVMNLVFQYQPYAILGMRKALTGSVDE